MSIANEIEKLNGLREKGAISEEEYQKAKKNLLDQHTPAGEKFSRAMENVSSDENMWSMFIHLSQLFGYFAPLAGLIVPIILWQVKKNESKIIDKHGRIVANWIITVVILAIVFGLLCFVFIGIPLLLALIVVGIVFPIIGGIKANSGEVWPYPFSIKFFEVD